MFVIGDQGAAVVSSSIVDNMGLTTLGGNDGVVGSFEVDYSNIYDGVAYPGEGNIDADPLLARGAGVNWCDILEGSPCIDAANPENPRDADGTRADMGRFPFLYAPDHEITVADTAIATGPEVGVWIELDSPGFYGAEWAVTADTAMVRVDTSAFVRTDNVGAELEESRTSGDTIFIARANSSPAPFSGRAVELGFKIKRGLPSGLSIPVTVLTPHSVVDEHSTALWDGQIIVDLLYGDVTQDGSVAMLDVSEILKQNVGLPANLDEFVADVTNNGEITAYDAAYVLHRVFDDEAFVFPVDGGTPFAKPAAAPALVVTGAPGMWGIAASEPAAVRSVEVTFLVDGAVSGVTGGRINAWRQEGDKLHVAAAWAGAPEGSLLTIQCDGAPPRLVEAEVNELPVLDLTQAPPVSFSLSQNVPNPFNPTTAIQFGVTQTSHVRLSIYSVNGQLVRRLIDGEMPVGYHTAVWDGLDSQDRPAASGMYLYRLTSPEGTLVKRMVMVR